MVDLNDPDERHAYLQDAGVEDILRADLDKAEEVS